MDPKQEMLERLWNVTVTTLLDKIESGEYTSQDLNIARHFLKDHSITVADVDTSPLGDLADIVPFSTTHQTIGDFADSLPSKIL